MFTDCLFVLVVEMVRDKHRAQGVVHQRLGLSEAIFLYPHEVCSTKHIHVDLSVGVNVLPGQFLNKHRSNTSLD